MIQQIERHFIRTSRPLYGHLVTLLESAIARGEIPPAPACPRNASSRIACASRGRRSSAPTASSNRAACWWLRRPRARWSAPPRTHRRAVRVAGEDLGRSPAIELIRSCATPCGSRRTPGCSRWAAGEPAIDRFPTAAFQHAVDHVLKRDAMAVWRHGPTEGQPALREDRRAVPRAGRERPDPRRRAAGTRSARPLPRRSRRCRDRRSPRLHRGDPVVPRRRRQADRLGRRPRRHRRARGSARPLPAEADFHRPHVPEPDRRDHADPRAASCSSSPSDTASPSSRMQPASSTFTTRRRRRCASSTRRTSSFT